MSCCSWERAEYYFICVCTSCVFNYVIILHNIQKELKDTRQSKINTQQELEKQTERLKVRDAVLYMVTIIIIVMVKVCMYVCTCTCTIVRGPPFY